VDSELIEQQPATIERVERAHGILVPGGFGERGIEGRSLRRVRPEHRGSPFLGICLGLQAGVIEFARNVVGLSNASSQEFVPDAEHRVIALLMSSATCPQSGDHADWAHTRARSRRGVLRIVCIDDSRSKSVTATVMS